MDLYITRMGDKVYYYYINEFDHIYDVYPEEMLTEAIDGNLYMGVIKDKKNAISAAFVDIGEENAGLLSYRDMMGEVKSGDSVLVQATRGGQGNKGAKLTMKFSLEGSQCVLLTDTDKICFSQRLATEQKAEIREALKEEDFCFGFIIRSGASDSKKLFAEMKRLQIKAEKLLQQSSFLRGPCVVSTKSPLDIISDCKDLNEIYTNDREIFKKTMNYVKDKGLGYAVHCREEDYFIKHDLKKTLAEALRKKIWLSGGGYLLIDKTEAMYVIDVNTGKTKGASNFEKTAYKTNLEAAKEIARQMRLRNLSGIILVDFIDMKEKEHQQKLLNKMREYTAKDAMAVTVHDLTKLGIMEITRKKKYRSLDQYLQNTSYMEIL